jgi:alpha-glucosidase
MQAAYKQKDSSPWPIYIHYDVVVISHHIMIDAHEPIKATGIREHTLWTREGARGMEWNGWSLGTPITYDITLQEV